jgi:hypothetical protein
METLEKDVPSQLVHPLVATNTAFDVHERIKSAEKEAVVGCGLSDVLYEANRQHLFAAILEASPLEERVKTAAALEAAGYDPEYKPFQPLPGECSLTGIDTNCCPCGRHP